MHSTWKIAACGLAGLFGGWLTVLAWAAPPSTAPVIGLRQNTPQVYALVGARIVVQPGQVIPRGTLVIRDGVIAAVGADVAIPAEARRIDLEGKTLYPGLIDAYSQLTVPADAAPRGAPDWNPQVTPQLDLAEHYVPDETLDGKLRSQGITARLVAPGSRIVKGQSIVVTTGQGRGARTILRRQVAQHFQLTVPFGTSREGYPSSPMGAVALARQTLLDAQWYEQAWRIAASQPLLPRPDRNDALEALAPCLHGQQPAVFDASNEQFFLRADRFAREFGLRAIIRGSGREYRRLAEIVATGWPVILPVNFPPPPSVATVEEAHEVSLAELMHWDLAPENPARLDAAGVTLALTSFGLSDAANFLSAVRRAVARGLKPDSALKALTINPAALLGVSDRLGKLAPGMDAHLVVTDGDLFASGTQVLETWVGGQRYEHQPRPPVDVRGSWQLVLTGADGRELRLELRLTGPTRQLRGTLRRISGETPGDEVRLTQVRFVEGQLSLRFEGQSLGKPGPARGGGTVTADVEGKLSLVGSLLWADGTGEHLRGQQTATLTPEERRQADRSAGPSAQTASRGKGRGSGKTRPSQPDEPSRQAAEGGESTEPTGTEPAAGERDESPASFPVNYPLGDFGRIAPPEAPRLLALKNATIWTCGPQGIVEAGTLVIADGKIQAVGKDLSVPAEATVVDLAGKVITPGIIDCHSHMATDGGINEGSQAITAEVRIGDFIDADDITIYRQLAGGVTAANILHGSANPIGGQNQVIKLRWGATGEGLKFAQAPPGIKFALGENVKQSNLEGRTSTRYPQSRMGVEQIIRDALAAARDYEAAWQRWEQTHQGLPPRRDLELEALAEVLRQKRWVHCHSYRQDEILALIRVFDDFGITIGSLQHILEGYKVADAMARHGATGSSFADWWAYKIEVFDAIPYNGALMHRQGVIVSFNSDDQELGRHLNHEAAKAIKYGGVPREEALKFVTLNPARQLRIDRWVGSLEAGKDADFVIWSGDPLSPRSRCEQTWIDGRKYFDREEDLRLRATQAQMRATLIRKVLQSGQAMQPASERTPEEWELWPRHDEACHEGDDEHEGHALQSSAED
jgi:N-acetylglucosamine-6-phosphate deacetylase